MKINLGCHQNHRPGFLNVDRVPPADLIADLSAMWPWADSSVDHLFAHDIIEHLPDKIRTMNEAWRVLRPDGILEIAVPTTDGPGAWQDPTHCSFWNRHSFLYYQQGTLVHNRYAATYGIVASFRVLRERLEQTPDGPRLFIDLAAVKEL